jgi:hypothetical protein
MRRRSGSPAVGHGGIWVVGGSGDQGTQGQGTQGQQNCDSRMKNIFLELKHYTTTDWDSHHLPFALALKSAKPSLRLWRMQKRFGLNSPFSLSQYFSS